VKDVIRHELVINSSTVAVCQAGRSRVPPANKSANNLWYARPLPEAVPHDGRQAGGAGDGCSEGGIGHAAAGCTVVGTALPLLELNVRSDDGVRAVVVDAVWEQCHRIHRTVKNHIPTIPSYFKKFRKIRSKYS
jgi:hypothetical protein